MMLRSTAFAIVLFLFSHNVFAALAENLLVGSAKANALANSVTADPPGIDSIHYNPAGLVKLKGRQYTLKGMGFYLAPETKFGENESPCLNGETCFIPGADFGQDPVANTTSKSEGITMALPFFGETELPGRVVGGPMVGFSYNPEGTNITFATQVYVPLGAGLRRGENDPGRFMGSSFGITRATVLSPSIGVQLSEQWSVGASLGVSWQGAVLATEMRLPNFATGVTSAAYGGLCGNPDSYPSTTELDQAMAQARAYIRENLNLCGGELGPYTNFLSVSAEVEDTFTLSYNLGVLWEPNEWFSWGMTYRSEGPGDMEGDFEIIYGEDISNVLGDLWRSQPGLHNLLKNYFPEGNYNSEPGTQRVENGKMGLKFDLPQHISTGVSVKLTPTFKVNFDLHWSDWGIVNEIPLEFKNGRDVDLVKLGTLLGLSDGKGVAFPRDYKSVVHSSIGFEYVYDDRITLRAGWEDRRASIPLDKADLLLPLGEADLVTGGLAYRWSKNTIIELGGGILISKQDVPAGLSDISNSNSQAKLIYNPYTGVGFETTTTAALFSANINSTF